MPPRRCSTRASTCSRSTPTARPDPAGGGARQLRLRPGLRHGALRPKAQLTAIIDNWADYYVARTKAALDGTWKSEDTWGGLKDNMVVMAPYKNMPDDVKKLAEETEAAINPASSTRSSARCLKQDGRRWSARARGALRRAGPRHELLREGHRRQAAAMSFEGQRVLRRGTAFDGVISRRSAAPALRLRFEALLRSRHHPGSTNRCGSSRGSMTAPGRCPDRVGIQTAAPCRSYSSGALDLHRDDVARPRQAARRHRRRRRSRARRISSGPWRRSRPASSMITGRRLPTFALRSLALILLLRLHEAVPALLLDLRRDRRGDVVGRRALRPARTGSSRRGRSWPPSASIEETSTSSSVSPGKPTMKVERMARSGQTSRHLRIRSRVFS